MIVIKLLKFLQLIKNSKFIIGRPKKNNLIIFDCETSVAIKILLSDKDYYLLKIRPDKIDTIYLNLELIVIMIKNFFKHSLKINYLLGLISQLDPKVILTQYDNSLEFYQLNKIFKNTKIKFISFQGHIRTLKNMSHLKENFYIDNYCGFSEYERQFLQQNGLKAKNFISAGSLVSAAALEYFKKNKIDLKIEYDVCLISELISPIYNELDEKFLKMLENLSLLIKDLKDEKKFRLIICGAGDKNSETSKVEKLFYDKIFGENNYRIDQSDRKKFPSYKNICKSKMVVGVHSTLMREALGLKKKILVYNFMQNTSYFFQFNDFFVVNEESNEKFKKKFDEINNLSDEEYFSRIKNLNFYMENAYNTKSKLTNTLKY